MNRYYKITINQDLVILRHPNDSLLIEFTLGKCFFPQSI